jgi:YegS/Rv2252/BmrU family lipid kinase
MSKTLIVLNPHAGGGRAGRLWTRIEPLLWAQLGELVVAVTDRPQDVAEHLDKAYASGLTRVVSIGGDGTNHALVNALAALNEQHPTGPRMEYGILPIGTGRDWARSQGIPLDPRRAAAWIAGAAPHPTDIGLLASDDLPAKRAHFLNIASVGISGSVVDRVNRRARRRPWTFLGATIASVLSYKPQWMRVTLDGQTWYDDRAWIAVVANGTTFAHGMKIAPRADVRDGLLDVILVEALAPAQVLAALRRVYNGSHLTHPGVRYERARAVTIRADQGAFGLELDGEYARGSDLRFSVRPQLINLLTYR